MERPLTRVFITVGTTKFDKLVQTVHTFEALKAFQSIGCKYLTIQTGSSQFEPLAIVNRSPSPHGDEGMEPCLPVIHTYDYKQSIADDIDSANLVISHAGAGTTLEVLRAGKPLIVVINEDLMNNHQTELADQLAADGFCYSCTPSTLVETLHKFDLASLKPFPAPNPRIFAEFVDQVLGFSSSK